MTETFDLIEFENHIIFKSSDQLILVDTGSPFTCANTDTLNFMGESYHSLSIVFQSVVDAINYPIDALMGLDILRNYSILFDYRERKITFSTDPQTLDGGKAIPFEQGLMGMLCTKISIADQEYDFVIDSGAKISYVEPSVSQNMQHLGDEEDFYPGMPRFTVPTYATTMTIADMQFDAVVGNLPPIMTSMLADTNVHSIIGSDLFTTFQVLINFATTELYLKPYNK